MSQKSHHKRSRVKQQPSPTKGGANLAGIFQGDISGDPATLDSAALAALRQYMSNGQVEDLNRALEYWQEAIILTSLDSPNRPWYLNNLANGLIARYARTGALEDLEATIDACRQAVQCTPSDSPNRPILLTNLGNGLIARYARTGALEDLEVAIDACRQAVQSTPSDSSSFSGRLTNLGNGLRERYACTGALEDLEAAIALYQQAVQHVPPSSPDLPISLNNLAAGLSDRYAATGALEDLEAAIDAHQQALRHVPPNSPDRAMYLNNLALELHAYFARTGHPEAQEGVIHIYRQAIQLTPSDSPNRPMYLNNLGNILRTHYAHSGALEDLEAAIDAYQQAVQLTPPDSPELPGYLNNLGTGRHDRYARTGALEDLEAAIDAYQQAVQYTPPNSPGHSMYLNNLGKSRHDRYARTGALEDLEAAITAWKVSWSLPALLFAEFPVAYQLGRQRERAGIASHLVNAYLERATQHGSSARIDLRSALEVVESSKSRLLTQMVGRGPLPLPAGVVPEIAAQEQQLLTALTALDTQDLATYDRLADAQEPSGRLSRLWQRQAFLKDLEQLWSRIAHIGPEGADYVALRRGESVAWNNLARLAKELGPATALLSLFMTPNRVLLFLLRAGWHVPRVVEVELDQTDWDDLLERFFREIHRYDRSLRRGETWESALRPLLEEAQGYLKGVERLVLAPAGYGHLLPWSVLSERAGLRTSKGLPLPLVTLPAQGVLPRLRRRSQIRTGTALVVGNPTGDLPYAEEEAKLVAQHFGTHPLIGAAATKDTVLTRLAEASPVHLATHAFFDPRDPLKSGIILADGILTAREVLEHRMHTDLVVLSACESGSAVPLGGEELAGLGQAFFQAGAQSLLISLWRVSDPATATLMQSFYAARQTGADKALALRQAQTQVQQESHWRHPYYWGAFVLLGDWD